MILRLCNPPLDGGSLAMNGGGAAEFISERYHSLTFATCSQNSHDPPYFLKSFELLLSVTLN